MKTKLFLMSATLLAALSLTGVASADTTRDQIEAEGNQQIQAYWNEYQQALQDRQNAWEQSHGDIYTPAWQDANAHAGAAYQEWLRAQTQLGDDLHNYDVDQWQKEEDQQQVDQISQQQQPQQDQQVTTTQASQISSDQPQPEATKAESQARASVTQPNQQASVEEKSTTHSSQQATPASQAKLSSQPATQELTQQASVADPASQPTTQSSQISAEQPQTEVTKTDQPQTKASAVQFSQPANVEAKSTTHNPQQATTSRVRVKLDNLSSQVKKPAQSNTVQNDQQTKLPQTGNGNLLTVVGTLLFAFLVVLIGVWKCF